jgi:hypothetical protein
MLDSFGSPPFFRQIAARFLKTATGFVQLDVERFQFRVQTGSLRECLALEMKLGVDEYGVLRMKIPQRGLGLIESLACSLHRERESFQPGRWPGRWGKIQFE